MLVPAFRPLGFLVFAAAAKRWESWKNALKGWDMVESQQVLEWMAQGRTEGRREGEARGELRGKKDVLLLQLRERFGTLDNALINAISGTNDGELLNRCLSLILKVESLQAFRGTAGI